MQFQIRPNLQRWKKAKERVSFLWKFVKITRFKVRISLKNFNFCSDLSKTGYNIYFFRQHKKGQKDGQMTKSFLSGKPFKKRPNGKHDCCN